MARLQPAHNSSPRRLTHPTADAIRRRAREVFGDDAKAASWMKTPRDLFDGRTPEELVACGNAGEQRRVLEVLIPRRPTAWAMNSARLVFTG